MWRVYRESNRPWPVICPEDDVIDYMVMEAVAIKVSKADEKARKEDEKETERTNFKEDKSELEQFR